MEAARKTWELENAVKLVDPRRDALYALDKPSLDRINAAHPWRSDPHHFKTVRISAIALLKMVMHARSGGSIEVMGLMIGYVQHETFIVTDAVRLPVEGTETRVNAQDEANEYLVQFLEKSRESGRAENAVGWYHSHPGYGCWLSGIDVATQHNWQSFSEPFVAVVVDPDRTVSAGKVEIGAFRTYPEGYKADGAESGDGSTNNNTTTSQTNNSTKPTSSAAIGNAAVPLAKAADFGAHANRYYALDVTHYKSSLDTSLLETLWNKYWVQTLSASPLFSNRDYETKQMQDLAGKLGVVRADWKARGAAGMMGKPGGGGGGGGEFARDARMDKVVRAAEKIAAEQRTGLLAAQVKEQVFGVRPGRVAAAVANETNGQARIEGEDVQMQA